VRRAVPDREPLHASAVAVDGRGVLFLGPSGAGKSALALDLMSRGAVLIADDRTILECSAGVLMASAPATIRGRIEARGVGILAAAYGGPAPISLAVDLARPAEGRLPPRDAVSFLGVRIELICAGGTANLAPALMQYLKGGRIG